MVITSESWLQAQYSVLGSALIEPKVIGKILTETSPTDFSGPCRTVYDVMRSLYSEGQAADIVQIADRLGQEYNSFLVQLMEITPTAANIASYISICRSQARVLALRELGGNLVTAATEEDARSLVDQANTILVEKQNIKVYTMQDLCRSFVERGQKEKIYTRWPITELNDRLYAEQGDFVILGGYPSAGKSALALQCAALWAREKRVGFYSLETSQDKLFDRLISSVQDLSMSDIKCNQISVDDYARLAQTGFQQMCNLRLEIVPAAGMTPADIKATAVANRHEIVIIDYLQLIQNTGSSRYEQVTGVSLALHTMAQTMGILVVALSQLKRRSGESPTMADLRESGQIEQDADLVMLLYLEDEEKEDGIRILRIAKNKEGTRPAIRLDFDGLHQRFSKADSSGKVAGELIAQGKKFRAQQRAAANRVEQFSLLPNNTPVPFEQEALP